MPQPNLVHTFLQEADDLLTQIEETALELEGQTADAESVNELFRAVHTIKGSAAMFGFDTVSSFTHHLENALDAVRAGRLALSADLLSVVLASKDHIKALLDAAHMGRAIPAEATETILAKLAVLSCQTPEPVYRPKAEVSRRAETWRIRFRPDPGLMACGGNPSLLFKELRTFGSCAVECQTDAVPLLEYLEPDKCVFWWEITLETEKDQHAVRDVFMFVEDGSEIAIDPVPGSVQTTRYEPSLAETTAAEIVGPSAVTSNPDQDPGQDARGGAARRSPSREATLRVPSGKLDMLVNLVGELVMNQSRLSQAALHSDVPELAAPVEEIERLVAELRDNVLGIRMMPIGTTFSRFKRLVHDLSVDLGKEIDLITEGAETELDKTVLDQLGDPLVHLIRNSIGHGIESREDRLRAGKPVRGVIRLTAVHTGSNVVVRIQDDGRGLNPQGIRAKAIEKQLIPPDANLSDKEVFNLIFLPGFSTAAEVTSVSGRGVGMDVVRRQIESLRGSVSITSDLGVGTTIALTLPLTLAIIEGLLVQVAGDQFIVPMSLVTENVELQSHERERNNHRNVIAVRGDLIPYVTLRDSFQIGGIRPDIEKIVIVQHEDERVGLVVDRVIGSHQTVIQSLGAFYKNVQVCSGATIMGDGRVALILDVAGLVRSTDSSASSATVPIPAARISSEACRTALI